MLEYDFQNSIGHAVCMTAHRFSRAMNEELVPQGITYRQCQILGWLAFDGAMTQVDLAERMQIEPASLVPVLDRMERDELIERVAVPTDRRCKQVRPLPKATTVWQKIVASAEQVRARATQGLSQEQIDTLRSLLQTVEHNLGGRDQSLAGSSR